MTKRRRTITRSPRQRGRAQTIDDVARLAKVSTATVSRYVNNPDVVAEETGKRVQAAIETLGYVPNAHAGSLASSSSHFIAILVPNLANSIVERTIERLVDRLAEAGSVPFLALTSLSEDRHRATILAALQRRAEAIVLSGPVPPDMRELLRRSDSTTIEMWGMPDDPVDVAVGFSHFEVGRALARFVWDAGYRRPHLVTGKGVRPYRRREGFLGEWERLGGRPATEFEVPIPSDFGHAQDVVTNVQGLAERPDVIVTGSDYLAIGVIAVSTKRGLLVPRDYAVIGFGDIAAAEVVRPPLTTVRIDGERIADETLNILRSRREGTPLLTNKVDCGFEIVRRESA
ncbi:LacI family DNA-binding transcriptional regulator [Tsuneonella sp. HG222]